jgi:hypothetical protein
LTLSVCADARLPLANADVIGGASTGQEDQVLYSGKRAVLKDDGASARIVAAQGDAVIPLAPAHAVIAGQIALTTEIETIIAFSPGQAIDAEACIDPEIAILLGCAVENEILALAKVARNSGKRGVRGDVRVRCGDVVAVEVTRDIAEARIAA